MQKICFCKHMNKVTASVLGIMTYDGQLIICTFQ
jgi:hypothetical protein